MEFLLISDLDDTLTGNQEGITEFNEIISSRREKFYLVYSSGRYKESMLSLIEEEKLISPDAIISNVGTEIYYTNNWHPDEEWEKKISSNWDREKIILILKDLPIEFQPYEKKYVIPCFVKEKNLVWTIEKTLKDKPVKVIHTKKESLDIIPESAGKGNAGKYIAKRINLPLISCGDSENDEDMLINSDYGILVGNASESVKEKLSEYSNIYITSSNHAKGVIEGLKFYKIIH